MKPTLMTKVQAMLHNIQADVTVAAISERDPGWSEKCTKVDFYRFVFVEQGNPWLEMSGKHYVASPGQLFFLPAGTEQAFGTGDTSIMRLRWCHYRANLGNIQLLEMLKLPVFIEVADIPYVQHLFDRMFEAHENRTITSGLKLKAALLELLAYFMDGCDLENDINNGLEDMHQLDEVFVFVEENLGRMIQVEELAKLVYLHPNYFIDYFKSLVGCSPIQYVNQRRLERARSLLEKSELPVAEIAAQIGLQNHYLSRLFKHQTGLSPSRYRKLYRSTYAHMEGDSGHEE